MAKIDLTKSGYGQVEPNHISAMITGQLYAQLPIKVTKDSKGNITGTELGTAIENGRFAKYDYAKGKVSIDADSLGEWMLIYNEEQKYDERYQMHKHYAMTASSRIDSEMVPRLYKINVGDIFTTNTFDVNKVTDELAYPDKVTVVETTDQPDVTAGAKVYVGANGYLTFVEPASYTGPVFQVGKGLNDIAFNNITMADGQKALKLQCVEIK